MSRLWVARAPPRTSSPHLRARLCCRRCKMKRHYRFPLCLVWNKERRAGSQQLRRHGFAALSRVGGRGSTVERFSVTNYEIKDSEPADATDFSFGILILTFLVEEIGLDLNNQRKLACQKNMKKQSDSVKGKRRDDGLSAAARKQRDSEIMQQKQKKANEKKQEPK
ncbi:hypothetical protein JEQ12_008770 [Ovis aries]|uniref:Small EDRK-rich factor-like N-terminal domain-containing protein n=1 Tax=Ovis aries TaxID=9940 RepID=A0A836AIM1_SHEEP|nr:hypothetical protein JEQ12_008770 [Ovis aries]